MKRSLVVLALSLGIVSLVISPGAVAQTLDPDGAAAHPSPLGVVAGPPGHLQPDAFGTNSQIIEIHASAFTPYNNTDTPGYRSPGYFTPGALAPSYYWTQLNVPLGAMINTVFAFVYDNDSANWTFSFRAYESATYSPAPDYIDFGTTSTSGTPGYTYLAISGGGQIVRAFEDLNADGTENEVSYNLLLWCGTPTTTSNLAFWGAEVNFSRTISPAPASASFLDVGTGHWAFQQIEALKASGITTGCDATHYCPNSNVTRAEMAVFLARALGLHWSH